MKTRYTIVQKILEVVGAILVLAYIIYLIMTWPSVPDQIPAHFNSAGLADRWGNKNELLVLPITGIVVYMGMTVIGLFPQIWNVPRAKQAQNLPFIYSMMKSMMIGLKVQLIAVFFCITYFQAKAENLPILVLPVFLLALFGSIAYYTIRCYRL